MAGAQPEGEHNPTPEDDLCLQTSLSSHPDAGESPPHPLAGLHEAGAQLTTSEFRQQIPPLVASSHLHLVHFNCLQ